MFKNNGNRGFLIMGILTLVAVYALILVGGIVRSTGSGMGCPDWPKCFGNYVPPSQVSDLPANYKEIYASKRFQKNKRVAKILTAFGMKTTADRILNDTAIYEEADFNPLKTWIEYFNRLLGVTVGILVFVLTIIAFRFKKSKPPIFIQTVLVLFLVVLEGWLGSLVVSTNLLPFMVTIHMGLALVIAVLLINVVFAVASPVLSLTSIKKKRASLFTFLLLGFSILQVLFGTRIRENVDVIAMNLADRFSWVSQLGAIFLVHRFMAYFLCLIVLYLGFLLWSHIKDWDFIGKCYMILLALVLTSLLTGIILSVEGFPPYLQPVHLLSANLLVGLEFLIFISLKRFKSVQLT
jgi:cytochrome c oxidase assembly protein subunit 15